LGIGEVAEFFLSGCCGNTFFEVEEVAGWIRGRLLTFLDPG
jgi:hypothetical protein